MVSHQQSYLNYDDDGATLELAMRYDGARYVAEVKRYETTQVCDDIDISTTPASATPVGERAAQRFNYLAWRNFITNFSERFYAGEFNPQLDSQPGNSGAGS